MKKIELHSVSKKQLKPCFFLNKLLIFCFFAIFDWFNSFKNEV